MNIVLVFSILIDQPFPSRIHFLNTYFLFSTFLNLFLLFTKQALSLRYFKVFFECTKERGPFIFKYAPSLIRQFAPHYVHTQPSACS